VDFLYRTLAGVLKQMILRFTIFHATIGAMPTRVQLGDIIGTGDFLGTGIDTFGAVSGYMVTLYWHSNGCTDWSFDWSTDRQLDWYTKWCRYW
jgi:hypothetical protein